ncbi:MAG: hypothetical protein HPY76_04525 [Anaerolineae bacterium]|nr:hypothetical protein [Anaerolineae bacterium]
MKGNSLTDRSSLKRTVLPLLALMVLTGLAYALLLNGWGFYKDDWHLMWTGSAQGMAGIIKLFTIDRPFMGVLYAFTYRLLGESPLAWSWFALGARFASLLAFWWLVRQLWHDQPRWTTLMAAVFILYPGFLQQPNANTFQNHFIGYAAALFSLGLSLRSLTVAGRSRRLALTLAALFFAVFYMLIYEYMIGLEAARLILMGYVLWRQAPEQVRTQRARGLIKSVLPYLLVMAVFLLWRLVIFKSARPVTDIGLVGSLYLRQPLDMLLRLALEFLKDGFETYVLAWFVPLYQLAAGLSYGSLLAALGIAALGGAVWFFTDNHLVGRDDANSSVERSFVPRDAILLGLSTGLVTLLPILLANRDVHFSDQFDRYTLQATLGVALATGGLVSGLRTVDWQRWAGATLIGLALVTQVANGLYYQRSWEYQRQLWWQLAWRAPDLADGTTLLPILPAGYRLAEGYEAWAPANIIFRPDAQEVALGGEILNSETLPRLLSQQTYGKTFRNLEYVVDLKNSLVLSLPPGGACLHVLGGEPQEVGGDEDPLARLAAPYSRPELILAGADPVVVPETIFGSEPAHDWCYFYQKVALARQRGDWSLGASLTAEVLERGLTPTDPVEWLPLYETTYRAGDMERANQIGVFLRGEPAFIDSYCSQFTTGNMERLFEDSAQQFLVTNLCTHLAP